VEALSAVTNLSLSSNTIGAGGSPNTQGIVIAPGDDRGTTLSGNLVEDNKLSGIVCTGSVTSLTVSGNAITNNGADGVQLAPGGDTSTRISGNTITGNGAYGVHFTGGVTGLTVNGNTIGTAGSPNANGLGVAGGDYTGTSIAGNPIDGNTGDGVDIGIGVPATNSSDNPLTGYANFNEHYVIPYAAPGPDFGSSDPHDPHIKTTIDGASLSLPLDTGSRGLYVSADQLPPDILDNSSGPTGYVYLNSSNKVFFGTWSTQTVTFADSTYFVNGVATAGPPAQATIPILVVTAVGASTTPAPSESTASSTFGTIPNSGTVTITNGSIMPS
jgi:parallel beta-helix repeat protein